MQLGCHVSISGSIDKAVDNAVERKCSAFQIFTRNPRGWNAKDLTDEDISNFKSKLESSGIDRFATCAHMPYLPNLATPKEEGLEKSLKTLINETERCAQLGIPYLVTHLGSHLGTGEEEGMKRLVDALNKAGKIKNDVMILLENTAGQKNSVGYGFEQLGEIFNKLKPSKKFDIVFCRGVLQHTPFPMNSLKNIHSFVKKDGYVFFDIYKMPKIGYLHPKYFFNKNFLKLFVLSLFQWSFTFK